MPPPPGPASERLRPPPAAEVPPPADGAPAPGSDVDTHYERCYGCGAGHPTGLHLVATVGHGVDLQARFTVTTEHQGAPGLAHGGLLAAALDEALGALMWILRRATVTVRLETDFLRPVPVGSTLHLTARCTGVSGRKVFTEAEGRLPDGQLAVRAAGLFVSVGVEHFAAHAPHGEPPPGLQRYNP